MTSCRALRADVPLVPWLPFAFVALVYTVVALQQYTLPGVYMDAINPDYMVVRVLNPHPARTPTWLLPGNYLFDRFPVLITLYHGSQQFWLGLPFFWLFGTSVLGVRLTHAVFGLAVLAATYMFLVRTGAKPWQAALGCCALALDPAFSYAFRSQSYITLAPSAWLFLALYSLVRSSDSTSMQGRWAFAAGLFYGLSIVGYFVYVFFAPAMVFALYQWRHRDKLHAQLRALPFGLLFGGSAYLLGYGLLIRHFGGLAEAWNFVLQSQRDLNAFNQQPDMVARLTYLKANVDSVFRNSYHEIQMFGRTIDFEVRGHKELVLLFGPLLLWIVAELQGRALVGLRVVVALATSFLAIAALFGTRLSGHHFMVLLPLGYSGLCLGLASLGQIRGSYRLGGVLTVAVLAPMVGMNSIGQIQDARELAVRMGTGLYSDAINRLAHDLDAAERKPFFYSPDWGLLFPVQFLTGGRVGVDVGPDFGGARRMLCEGRDVAVAVITGDRVKRIAEWQQALRWDSPTIVPYVQGNGEVAFDLAIFHGTDQASC